MRYDLKIEGTAIPVVTQLDTEIFFRNETQLTNLEGGEILYRGKKKYRLKVLIALASHQTLAFIDGAIDDIFVSVNFYEGNSQVTKTMRIRPYVKPSPRFLYGDLEKGVYYENVKLVIEEK